MNTPSDLDSAPFLRLMLRTVGLLGPGNADNRESLFDFDNACKTCGAGARPRLPVHVPLASMGKKRMDFTAHCGLLIVARDLIQSLRTAKLSGFETFRVRDAKGKAQDERFE